MTQGSSCRRSTSLAVFTNVLNAAVSSGLGFFLSRPIVHGPTSAGSASPALIISTAQPSSSLFLMTRAVQPLSRHSVGSCSGSVSARLEVFMGR